MEKQQSSSRMVAFTAIVFSTVAVTGCLLAFPLVFHFIQILDASIQSDLDFCQTRSRDMWNEMMDIHIAGGQHDSARVARAMVLSKENEMRMKRFADKSQSLKFWADRIAKDQPEPRENKPVANPSAAQQSYGGCCTCHRGPAGPPGPPGRDGADGGNGSPGQPGERGEPAPSDRSLLDFYPKQCPCEGAPQGDQGPAGPRGADGQAGAAGAPGGDGQPGGPGPRGPPGENGRAGQNGQKGPTGDAGRGTSRAGAPGAPGGPGRTGAAGAPGQTGPAGKDGQPGSAGGPGDIGAAGANGRPGGPGSDGNQGLQGDPGTCTHCPPARLAPGY